VSTKLYTAYRFPLDKLVPFQEWVRPQMMEAVHAYVRSLGRCVTDEAVAAYVESRRPSVMDWVTDRDLERVYRATRALDLIEEFRNENGRHAMLTIDCGWSLWPHGRHWYAIPYGLPMFYEDLELPSWVEDFAYWDNTDRPDHLSAREWAYRRKTWDAVCLGGRNRWDRLRLTYPVVDTDPLSGSPWYGELLNRYIRRQPEANDMPKLPAPKIEEMDHAQAG
jgi:hypothetical protein